MPIIHLVVKNASGRDVSKVKVTSKVSGVTSFLTKFPAIISVPNQAIIEFDVSGVPYVDDSVLIELSGSQPPIWSNPNVKLELAQGEVIKVTFFMLTIAELPMKLLTPSDIATINYSANYSPQWGSKKLSKAKREAIDRKVGEAIDLKVDELFNSFRDYAAVVDAGGGRPQYYGFEDFPKERVVCVDPDRSGTLVIGSTLVGWNRVRHKECPIDPSAKGVTYILLWPTTNNSSLLVGVYVPKVRAVPQKRNYCVFYTANTAKPEFKTSYPFGWRWFRKEEQDSDKVIVNQPYFDLIARFLFRPHFIALQSLCSATTEPPPVMIVPVWNHGSALSTPLASPTGLLALVYEVARFIHRKGLNDPRTTPERDDRPLPKASRQGLTTVNRQHVECPEIVVAVACHSRAIDDIIPLAQESSGSTGTSLHREWSYLWLLDPVWRKETPSVIKLWLGSRQDRRTLVIDFQGRDYVQPLSLQWLAGSFGGAAITATSRDERIYVFQGNKTFLEGPDTGVVPKWGETPMNDEHQFVPDFGVGLGIKLAEL